MGLLEGLGLVFGAGVAGAGKAAGDTFADQLKNEALAMREENMARINSIYAKDAQKSHEEFASKESEKVIKSQEGIAQATRDLNKTLTEGGWGVQRELQTERIKHDDMQRMLDRALTIDQNKEAREFQESMIYLSKGLDQDIQDKASKNQLANAKAITILTHQLDASAPGTTGKIITDLVKYGGMSLADAKSAYTDSLRGVTEDKKIFGDALNGLIRNANANAIQITPDVWQSMIEQARTAAPGSGKAPAGAGTKAESPIEREKREFEGSSPKATGAAPARQGLLTPTQERPILQDELDWAVGPQGFGRRR